MKIHKHFCQLNTPFNNPISTTYPISNLSTQLSHPKSSGYVSAQYNKQKIRELEQFFQTVPTLENPLFSALFRYSISPPVTSTRHSQHGSSGYAEFPRYFYVRGNISTAYFTLLPFVGICLLTSIHQSYIWVNNKFISICPNYFIIPVYCIIRNICNKIFIYILCASSLSHKNTRSDRHKSFF